MRKKTELMIDGNNKIVYKYNKNVLFISLFFVLLIFLIILNGKITDLEFPCQKTSLLPGIHRYSQVFAGIYRYLQVFTGIHMYLQVYHQHCHLNSTLKRFPFCQGSFSGSVHGQACQ